MPQHPGPRIRKFPYGSLRPTLGRVSRTTRWALLAAVPLAALAAVSLAFALRSSSPAPEQTSSDDGVTWAAGEQAAPALGLQTPDGKTVSLGGGKVIVTFVDPHCTTFCPRESLVIEDAVRALPTAQRPRVIAVSVDPTVTSATVFAQEARRFKWSPQWTWATGTPAQLHAAWRRYHITVIPTKRDITHTEAAYVIDANGDQRSLLLWPYRKQQLLRALSAASS
jgi:cytochrome oxidase Cu insertion factor (SCO1/SenC/PrrC family)